LPNAATDLNLSPQRKRERLFEALLNEMGALSRRRPVLAMFEDAHWIDPTSREMLDLMVDRVRRMPVLLVVTFRPEFQQSWVGQPHVTMLALNRLDDQHVAALVRGLAGNTPLGSEVVQEIAERTDGVPLFVEELAKAVLERSDQDRRVAAVLSASPLSALAVPSTLHASLIARLDRIGPAAKEVAQICSVFGREFTYELIERLATRPRPDLKGLSVSMISGGVSVDQLSRRECRLFFTRTSAQSDDCTICRRCADGQRSSISLTIKIRARTQELQEVLDSCKREGD
jgi:predicted ATPase